MANQVALITGASTGLGEVFAHRFARDGRDVVLVARSEARLVALAERLRVQNITAHVLPFDLSKPDSPQALFDAVKARGLEVEWLVNNAGFGTNGAFLDLPLGKEAEMVELNCTALLKLCHLFATPMRARRSGRILNIASTAGFQPGPYMATYYATKAFVVSLSEALSYELAPHGVTVTCSCPGATHTEFAARSGNEKSRLFQRPGISTPNEVVDGAYESMMQGEVMAVHGWLNWVAVQAVRFSPRVTIRAITAALNLPPNAER